MTTAVGNLGCMLVYPDNFAVIVGNFEFVIVVCGSHCRDDMISEHYLAL